MPLAQFLALQGLSKARFAERIGVTAESVRRYARGKRTPCRAVMLRIIAATGGAVTADDFLARSEPDQGAA